MPERTKFLRDGNSETPIFHVKVWNHPTERTAKKVVVWSSGWYLRVSFWRGWYLAFFLSTAPVVSCNPGRLFDSKLHCMGDLKVWVEVFSFEIVVPCWSVWLLHPGSLTPGTWVHHWKKENHLPNHPFLGVLCYVKLRGRRSLEMMGPCEPASWSVHVQMSFVPLKNNGPAIFKLSGFDPTQVFPAKVVVMGCQNQYLAGCF